MTKLTDTQLILLSSASQRDDGSIFPLPAAVADGGSRISNGIAALLKRQLVGEFATSVAEQCWREADDQRFGLVITDAGRAAIGVDAADQPAQHVAGDAPTGRAFIRPGSKQARLVEMLSAPDGASLDELVRAMGWLPHTTRAAITGLRKRGLTVLTEKREGACAYRIAAA